MDEREFFDEKLQPKTHQLTCPHCQKADEYQVTWLVRRKRSQPPRGADDATLAKFKKAQSYMVRRDDVIGCKNDRCRKRFEIDNLQSVAYMQEAATGSVEDRTARLKAAFGRKV
jgi:sarcosine oxidase delta subunit